MVAKMYVHYCARGNHTKSFDNRLTFPRAMFAPHPTTLLNTTPQPYIHDNSGPKLCSAHCLQSQQNMRVRVLNVNGKSRARGIKRRSSVKGCEVIAK